LGVIGLVTSFNGLLVARFFLGLFEGQPFRHMFVDPNMLTCALSGGVFPGLVLYLSSFYPRRQLQWRFVLILFVVALTSRVDSLSAYLSSFLLHLYPAHFLAYWPLES
jgi:MFS family permease